MRKGTLILFCLALLVLGAGVYYWASTRRETAAPAPRSSAPEPATPAGKAVESAVPAQTQLPAPLDAAGRMAEAREALLAGASAEEARRILQEVRAFLKRLPPGEAVAAARAFLDSAADAGTPLEFSITTEGLLKEAPSLRVWLLDCLGEIDRAAAADYARGILGQPRSPDEWAISLRDYALARQTPEDAAFLEAKLREMLAQPAWKQKPSAGFLEAFDTIVYLNGKSFTPDLAQLVSDKENRAVGRAAFLTLDRLVLRDPAPVLEQLAANPQLLAGREQTRANFFARADVREPQQRAVLERYLLDPARTAQEMETFAGLYPSGNFMVSNNLLTKISTPVQGEIAAHDREALAIVGQWIADPRFAGRKAQLEKIRGRLAQFVEQSRRQGN